MGRRGVVVAVLVALTAVLACVPAAGAASLVFVRAGDLYAASADGAIVRGIANGPEPFSSPTVDPAGNIWAINGRSIVAIAPSGAVLRAIALPLADAPTDLDLSPDGARLAVEVGGSAPGTHVLTTADGALLPTSYPTLIEPAWVSTSLLVLHQPAASGAGALFANVDAATPAANWFTDATNLVTDGDVSTDALFGAWTNNGGNLVVRVLTGPPPAAPTGGFCSYPGPSAGPAFDPTAGSHRLAFRSDDGIWVITQPEPPCGNAVRMVSAPEISDVAWNPVDVVPGAPFLTSDGRARLTGLALAAKSFPAATGTTLAGTATSAGTVSMTVIKVGTGLRKGRACVASRKKGKKLQRCPLRTVVGAPVPAPVAAGAFSLAVLRPDLTRGSYELAVILTDAIGRVSVVKRLAFKIP